MEKLIGMEIGADGEKQKKHRSVRGAQEGIQVA